VTELSREAERFSTYMRTSNSADLVASYARAITEVDTGRSKPGDMIAALGTVLCALVKASAPPQHWPEVAAALGSEMRRQLSA